MPMDVRGWLERGMVAYRVSRSRCYKREGDDSTMENKICSQECLLSCERTCYYLLGTGALLCGLILSLTFFPDNPKCYS